MKNKKIWGYLGVVLLLMLTLSSKLIHKKEIIGTYVNVNFGESSVISIPGTEDTLFLNEDNTYFSSFYGNGIYKVIYSGLQVEVQLIPSDASITGVQLPVVRHDICSVKILLDENFNQYYEKRKIR